MDSLQSSATSSTPPPSSSTFSIASSATNISRQTIQTWLERVKTAGVKPAEVKPAGVKPAGVKRKRYLSEEAETTSGTLRRVKITAENLKAMAGLSTPKRFQVSSLTRPATSPSLRDNVRGQGV